MGFGGSHSNFSPVVLVGHAGLDLSGSSGDVVREVLVASRSDKNNVLDTHTADLCLVFADFITVQVLQIKLIKVLWNFSIKQEISEIATRLNCDHIIFFDNASSAYISKTGLGSALWSVIEIATDIMAIKTNEMSKTMGHKEEADALAHHFVDVSCDATKFD